MRGRAALSRRRIAFERRDLFKQPLSAAEIKGLGRLAPDGVRSLLSTRTAQYKALGLDRGRADDDTLAAMMAREPRLLRRPLAVKGQTLVIGYDEAGLAALD